MLGNLWLFPCSTFNLHTYDLLQPLRVCLVSGSGYQLRHLISQDWHEIWIWKIPDYCGSSDWDHCGTSCIFLATNLSAWIASGLAVYIWKSSWFHHIQMSGVLEPILKSAAFMPIAVPLCSNGHDRTNWSDWRERNQDVLKNDKRIIWQEMPYSVIINMY